MLWYKLFFDERPKNRRKDLYNMEKELGAFVNAVKRGDPLIVLAGLRRTGKTSLLLTGLNEMSNPSIVLDLRALAGQPYATRRDLIREIERGLNKLLEARGKLSVKLLEHLKRLRGVEVSATGVSLSWGGKNQLDLADLFDQVGEWASREGQRVVVAFDEAQELKKIAGIDVAKFIAHVYDYCRDVSIVLTGSAVGLLYDFMGVENPKAPLYGRGRTEINLQHMPQEKARDFLLRGFRQAKLKVNLNVIHRAVEALDGVIGWLTIFGATCIKRGVSDSALDETLEAGKAIARQEFENFLREREAARRRYQVIVRHLANRPSSWSAIKGAIEADEGRVVNDRNINDLLTTLVKAGFVEKRDVEYVLTDFMLARAFL